jgi:CRISPR-associated protein Cmr1
MARTMPKFPDKVKTDDLLNHHPGRVTRNYEIEVITPLFGGGVEAGKVDPEHPIRESSIRGHLRFWWRATRGAEFSDVRELRKREGEIWGSTENPSPVDIILTRHQSGKSKNCGEFRFNQMRRQGRGGYDLYWWNDQKSTDTPAFLYTLFPYKGKDPMSRDPCDPSEMIGSAKFSLRINIPTRDRMSRIRPIYNEQRRKENERLEKENKKRHEKQQGPVCYLPFLLEAHDDIIKDIDAAVWAWVNFGGIGARTRRGCGALFCKPGDPSLINGPSLVPPIAGKDEIHSWYSSCRDYFGIISSTLSKSHQWPTLPEQIFIKIPSVEDNISTDPVSNWYDSISVLHKFRQGFATGRDNGPGRSRWPEAESLREQVYGSGRRIKSNHLIKPKKIHSADFRMSTITTNFAFPRSEFGMPIILEIRDEGIKPTIQPGKDIDRMASPIILRPIRCNDGLCISMIVRLNTLPLKSAYVKPGDPDREDNTQVPYTIPQNEIVNTSFVSYKDSPMQRRCTSGSAIEAFLSYAENENGFKRVG